MERRAQFSNSNGDKLSGIYERREDVVDAPIVVIAHGFSTGKDSAVNIELAKRLIEHNIASFRFDFFGHGESEGKFDDVTLSEAIDDVSSAVNFLRSEGYSKIALIGSSFGGAACLLTSVDVGDVFAMALKSPVSNYYDKERLKRSPEEIQKWEEVGYVTYVRGDGTKFNLNYTFFTDLKQHDGYKIAEETNIPTLIVHGDADETVPYDQSVKTCSKMPDCTLHTIKGATHRYDDASHHQEMIDTIVDFIVSKVK